MSPHTPRDPELTRVVQLLVEKVLAMALDLSKLAAEVERSNKAAAAVLAAHAAATDPALQATVDALTAKLAEDNVKLETAAPPGT